ncbi:MULTISPECIES: hypothetical protein [Corynebacterium]|uniref:hypothetical protein n=1 Tax=Corynebacterium TaxID=1716 RepID=UPI00165E092A|nr:MULTISPECIES: hypothetical protein [Corynebacterium]MDU3111668.1 hypothetical protein [Corynebacterium sp.]UVE00500.1 hypothetical protein NU639_10375 [Corynebacterium amycolatum]
MELVAVTGLREQAASNANPRARDRTKAHAIAAFEIIFPKNLEIALYFAYMFD